MENDEMILQEEETTVEQNSKQSRWRSWALYLSLFGLLSVIFTALNVWEKIGITSETFDVIVGAIGTVLTAFGIVNNPTESGGL